ncbi:hypothetical protein ABK905_14600 [Acerihabitans sp. KWT182]|uniref:Uncharacterized protein n=1 Tax=Acerihabitans sp. KWT182 TaxID=3157919 RepID=A0AAU7Q4K9_9GAMM
MMHTIKSAEAIINQNNNSTASLTPQDAVACPLTHVIKVGNSPESILRHIPAITEKIAAYLKEPDYSRFVGAIKGTSLRSLDEIYQAYLKKKFLSRRSASP